MVLDNSTGRWVAVSRTRALFPPDNGNGHRSTWNTGLVNDDSGTPDRERVIEGWRREEREKAGEKKKWEVDSEVTERKW